METDRLKLYFDYASTAPLDPRVLGKMRPYLGREFGNPSNLYKLGRNAKRAIDGAKEKICAALNCGPQEFIFTGSATEADNLAVLGIARANKHLGNKIITSAIEHKAVLAACRSLEEEGFKVVEIGVDKDGLVNPKEIAGALDDKTVLVSIMYANNEIGTIQPIKEIADIIRNFRKSNKQEHPYFHTDASQAVNYLDIDVKRLGVDLLTLSGHKIYGPKGVGGLYVHKGIRIKPFVFGGGQQAGIRPGTENIAAIVGLGEAMMLAEKIKRKEYKRIKALRDRLERGIRRSIPKVILNGHPELKLPNILNVSILDIEGESALLRLDEFGISVNTGSACNSQSLEPSYVLMALGRPYEYIHGSLRFSLGRYTAKESVDYLLKILPETVKKLRQISPVNLNPGDKKEMSLPQAFVGGQTPHFL